ncbi:hypothetical protein [Synechococcus sp. UW179A]|uniref:hypothetical protein n=1 Tax=Synechococcus sp. UW179A TaxID=2575510 RepID=UPI001A7E0A4B|nr:hypothetical protein [Synechococcus sp. UW179A]
MKGTDVRSDSAIGLASHAAYSPVFRGTGIRSSVDPADWLVTAAHPFQSSVWSEVL